MKHVADQNSELDRLESCLPNLACVPPCLLVSRSKEVSNMHKKQHMGHMLNM